MEAATAWAAVGALGTLAAVGVAAWAARQSRDSATEANAAAKSLAAIERERRHDELAPSFDITFTETGSDHANLLVKLAGGRLESLDDVTVTILDETGKDHWAHGLPAAVTQEQAEAFVWGPWEFNTGASAQVASNRESRPRAYSRMTGKNWDLLALTRTRPGHWMTAYTQERWEQDYEAHPIRLLITCRREGYEPWTLLHEISAAHRDAGDRWQARQVEVTVRAIDGASAGVLPQDKSALVHTVDVSNGSARPIRNLACRLEAIPVGATHKIEKLADLSGEIFVSHSPFPNGPTMEGFASVERGDHRALLRSSCTAAFVWSLTIAECPSPLFTVRFTDDAEIDWELDHELRLRSLPHRDW